MPSSPSGRAPPTGPRSERERDGRGEEAPQRLADRLAPAGAASRNVGDEQPSRRGGERGKGRDRTPTNQDDAMTPTASGEGDIGGGHSRKRAVGDGQRMIFEHAMTTRTGAGTGAAGSKRVKIDRKRRAAANKES